MTRNGAIDRTRDDETDLDERAGTGLFHRALYLKGWSRHVHGYVCPRCGATCAGKDTGSRRSARNQHDTWHREDDEYHDEWAEKVSELDAEVVKVRGQVELFTELLGRALDRILQETES